MLDQTQPTEPSRRLNGVITALARKRDKAITGRQASGIEQEWLEDEEFYLGIDDANRAFQRTAIATAIIPKLSTQPVTTPDGSKSMVFLNITRPFVDAAAARLADMLLPSDEACWGIKPTPIAEMSETQAALMQAAGVDWQAQQEQIQTAAEAAAKAMATAIEDELEECGWQGSVRAVIEDAARIGSGVLKGPVPAKRTAKKWVLQDGNSSLQVQTEIAPTSKRIDPWNFYPDPACGEDIHDGGETWERSYITPKQLRDMRDMPGYDSATVDRLLKEGPKAQATARAAGDGTHVPVEGQFELWTHYGVVGKDDALEAGIELNDETPLVNVMALLVGDQLVKIELNPMDTGDYPYDVLAWQRRPGMPWGMGIGRHIRTPQRMLNASCRAMMDNAAMVAGIQLVIGNGVTPQDGVYGFNGRKLWRADPEVLDVRGAFSAFVPPSVIDEMLKIIEFARAIAEQTTGMPMLLQGQQTQGQAADTLGGMQLLQNNASGVLRRLAKRFDDYLTEPHIRRYYNWMMQYDERTEIKGDFQIDVLASSALIERDSQKQFMLAAMQFARDQEFGIDPYKLFTELAKSDRMQPKNIQIPEEEYRQRLQKPNELDQANAALANARAASEEAKAVLARVQTMFSAINTANLAAGNPALAPAADVTLESAGFRDSNSPPIVGQVAAGVVQQPMPENTSPNFPPTGQQMPQSDVGAAAGIEGGGP